MKQKNHTAESDIEEDSTLPFSRPCKKKMKQDYGTGLPQGNTDRVVKRAPRSTTKEKTHVLDKASSSSNPSDLSFSVRMKTTYVRVDYRMTIPSSFANKYMKKWKGDIILKSVDEKTWAATSSFSSFDVSEIEAEEPQVQPAEELLPTQEPSLMQTRLEHVEPKITNPFATLDFSFMATPAPTPIPLSYDAIAAAHSVIADVLTLSLDVCSSRASEVMDSFDVLIRESKNAKKADMITEIKGRVAVAFSGYLETNEKSSTLIARIQSHMVEINAYKERHKNLDMASLEDKTRVEELKENEAKILELEKQLTFLKGKKYKMLRACKAFRDSLPKVEKELLDDQDRLSGYYESIQQWHRESEEYRIKAERLRFEWAQNSSVDLAFLFP
ncbi:hypothetical protein M5689_000054 [Euphorbia peplus]|nr:hypothetical protein M5689_000054 [Euphorbia peplus]